MNIYWTYTVLEMVKNRKETTTISKGYDDKEWHEIILIIFLICDFIKW